jgi:hypothetical protein
MAAANRLKQILPSYVQRRLVAAACGYTVNINQEQMADPILRQLVEQLISLYPEFVDAAMSEDQAYARQLLGVGDLAGMEGLNGLCEDIEARVVEVKREQRKLRKGAHKYATAGPPWPGGYPTYALIVMLSWSVEDVDRVLELLGDSEHSACLHRFRDVLIAGASGVFQRRKASLVDSGKHQHVLTLAQAQAASLFHAMHDQLFWNACVDSALGVDFADKDTVFMALSTFGKKASSVQAGESVDILWVVQWAAQCNNTMQKPQVLRLPSCQQPALCCVWCRP